MGRTPGHKIFSLNLVLETVRRMLNTCRVMKTSFQDMRQTAAESARRIVIKVGSRVLIRADGRPNAAAFRMLSDQVSDLCREGREVVLVSSGAIGAGMEALGLRKRPTHLPDMQMAAAVGQTRLMSRYADCFARKRQRVGQVLLTHDGLKHRERHLNARHTLLNLLHHGIVPIVNENDAVAVDDIKFGDNDMLAAMVSVLVNADLLILLTTVNGLYRETASGRRRIPYLEYVTKETLALSNGKGDHLSTGGMSSKLESAQMAVKAGATAVIANGRTTGIIKRILQGENVGTWVPSTRFSRERLFTGKQRWIAFFHRAEGALVVDDGARDALIEKGRSLLPIGIRSVEGAFSVGAMVNIKTADGQTIARGLVEYDSRAIERIKGRRTSEIQKALGSKDYDEVIHRDDMVLLRTRKGEIT